MVDSAARSSATGHCSLGRLRCHTNILDPDEVDRGGAIASEKAQSMQRLITAILEK